MLMNGKSYLIPILMTFIRYEALYIRLHGYNALSEQSFDTSFSTRVGQEFMS